MISGVLSVQHNAAWEAHFGTGCETPVTVLLISALRGNEKQYEEAVLYLQSAIRKEYDPQQACCRRGCIHIGGL